MSEFRQSDLEPPDENSAKRPALQESAHDVYVDSTEGRGRGLFIAKARKAGEIVLTERPLVAMQSLDNTQDVTVCRNCLGFAGDVISQLEMSIGVPRLSSLERFEERHHGNKEVPNPKRATLSGLHRCLKGCGELYCSFECRAEHFERGHRLLCVGPVPEEEASTHPLVAFRVHAMETNEIFLLTGEVVAQIVSSTAAAGKEQGLDRESVIVSAQAPFADFVQKPWWDVAVARGQERESDVHCGDGLDGDSDRAVPLSETLRHLCEESAVLLRDALSPLPSDLETVVSAERIGRIVGMFEQNNVGIRAPSPVPLMIRHLLGEVDENVECVIKEVASLVTMLSEGSDTGSEFDDGPLDEIREQDASPGSLETQDGDGEGSLSRKAGLCEELMSGTVAGGAEENVVARVDPVGVLEEAAEAVTDDSSRIFEPLDGTALYSLVCCMNHSCRPNCFVRYPGRRRELGSNAADPLVVQIVLLEDVGPDEELTQSYISNDMGVQERRSALEDYGFLCECPRCREEEAV